MKTNKRSIIHILKLLAKTLKVPQHPLYSHIITQLFLVFLSYNPKLLLMMVSKTSLLVNLENCYAKESNMSTEKQECKSLGYLKDSLCKTER
jgi:hypothetical protein